MEILVKNGIPMAYQRMMVYDRSQGGGSIMETKQFELNDVVEMKKQHPCGTNAWKIITYGCRYSYQM